MKEKRNDILSLRWWMCRYITNEDMSRPEFCCETVVRGSYCKQHAKLCYLPPKKNDLLRSTE